MRNALLALALFATPVLAQTPPSQPVGITVAPVGSADHLDVSAYFQPYDDAESVALRELAKAQKTVHIAHYNIRNTRFYDALVALKNRGVEVQIATDLTEASQPWNWLTGQFVSAGFDVVKYQPPTNPHAIMHLKACVIDGSTVLTGSYNWNNTAQLSNDENMLVIRDAQVAGEYERYLAAIRSNTVTTWKPQIKPGSPIEVHFSPGDKPETVIAKLAAKATSRITAALFTITDKYAAQALEDAAKRGVTVELVTEAKEAAISPVISAIMASGCRVVIGANTTSSFSAMHHKYAVIDDTVVTGACNWTKTAFMDSCEDIVVIRDAGLARAYRHNWKSLIKRYDALDYDPFQFQIATPTAHVELVTLHDRTVWGDRVFVVGNCDALGNWDPAKAVELRTADDIYPKWSGSVELPAGANVEYKYITITGSGTVYWEDGANRTFTVDPEGTDEARIEAYRFP